MDKHIKQYIDQELASYPLYLEGIRITKLDIPDVIEGFRQVSDSPKPSNVGVSDVTSSKALQIANIEERLRRLEWRAKRIEAGVSLFPAKSDHRKIITVKYFESANFGNVVGSPAKDSQVIDFLDLYTDKYYRLLAEIRFRFGIIFGVDL